MSNYPDNVDMTALQGGSGYGGCVHSRREDAQAARNSAEAAESVYRINEAVDALVTVLEAEGVTQTYLRDSITDVLDDIPAFVDMQREAAA